MHDQITIIDFHGDTIFAIESPDGVFIAVKPICQRLGVAWNGQFERIKRDTILTEGIRVIRIPSVSGPQETTCLPLDMINGWLFGIDDRRIENPEIRARVLIYKRECYRALFERFHPAVAGAPPARENPPATPGLDDLSLREAAHRLAVCREARHLFGPKVARRMWDQMQMPSIDLAEDDARDALSPALERFMADCCDVTGNVGDRTPSAQLWNAFNAWAATGDARMTEQAFYRGLAAMAARWRCPTSGMAFTRHKASSISYLGLRLKAWNG